MDRHRSSTSSSSEIPSTTSSVGLKSGNLTPKKATEIIVNWAIDTGQGGTLSTNLGPEYTSAFAMLDCRGLDSSSLRTPENLGYDMHTAIKDMARNKMQSQSRLAHFFLYQLKTLPENKVTRESVEQELDDELKSGEFAGILEPWDSNLVMTFDDKITRVAEQRVMRRLFEASGSMPARESRKAKLVEFQVQLERLVDGMGNHSQTTTLRFAYTTSYHEFLKALQEATSLCRIPPKHHDELGTGKRAYFKPIRLFSSAKDGQASPTDLANLTTTEQRRGSTELSIDPRVNRDKPKGREVKGYTMDDGVWIYRTIQSLDSGPIQSHEKHGGLRTIKDGADYREMILSLKAANSGEKKLESETKTGKVAPVSAKSECLSLPCMHESGNSTPMLLDAMSSSPFGVYRSGNNTRQPPEPGSSPSRLDQRGSNTPCPPDQSSSPASKTPESKEYTHRIWIMHSQDFVEQGVWKKAFKEMEEEDEEFRRGRADEGEDIPRLWSVYWERENEKYF